MAKAKYVLPEGYKKADVSFFNGVDKVYTKDGKVWGPDGKAFVDPVFDKPKLHIVQNDQPDPQPQLPPDNNEPVSAPVEELQADNNEPVSAPVEELQAALDAVQAREGDTGDAPPKREVPARHATPETAQPRPMAGKYPANMDHMPTIDEINGYK